MIYEPVEANDELADLYNDRQFYIDCCLSDGTGCSLFYDRRPLDNCEYYVKPFCCGEFAPSLIMALDANDKALL